MRKNSRRGRRVGEGDWEMENERGRLEHGEWGKENGRGTMVGEGAWE